MVQRPHRRVCQGGDDVTGQDQVEVVKGEQILYFVFLKLW